MPDPWVPDRAWWSGRSVAVTGATGFVGSHLTSELVRLGAAPVILMRDDVRPNPISAEWLGRVAVVRGDITDQALVERLLSDYSVSAVFHLAAQSQVGVAVTNPASTFDTNVRGTWALLEAVRRCPAVVSVVSASSDKAYGENVELPYTEDTPLRAVHPYDVSKACADLIAVSYANSFGVPVSVTRCANFFGPGDLNWSRLVPGTIRSLLRGERPVIRSDGTMVRDYLGVRDGVTAYLCVAEWLAKNPAVAGRAFNFSLEQPLTVLQMVSRIQEVVGSDLAPDIAAVANHEISQQSLSSARARDELGWKPAGGLADALVETVDWYRRYLAL